MVCLIAQLFIYIMYCIIIIPSNTVGSLLTPLLLYTVRVEAVTMLTILYCMNKNSVGGIPIVPH